MYEEIPTPDATCEEASTLYSIGRIGNFFGAFRGPHSL